MLESGVLVRLAVTSNGTENDDNLIVQVFMMLIGDCHDEHMEKLHVLFDDHQRTTELRANNIQLIEMNKIRGRGIGLFYWCQSLPGLQYLYELYSSGQLKVRLKNCSTYC
jgi:hypothetical protein